MPCEQAVGRPGSPRRVVLVNGTSAGLGGSATCWYAPTGPTAGGAHGTALRPRSFQQHGGAIGSAELVQDRPVGAAPRVVFVKVPYSYSTYRFVRSLVCNKSYAPEKRFVTSPNQRLVDSCHLAGEVLDGEPLLHLFPTVGTHPSAQVAVSQQRHEVVRQ